MDINRVGEVGVDGQCVLGSVQLRSGDDDETASGLAYS